MKRIIVLDGMDEELVNRAVDKIHNLITEDTTFLNVELTHYLEEGSK